MLSILNERFVRFDEGKSAIIAELTVDTIAELPRAETLEGIKLCQGSMAWVIESGAILGLSGSGEWVDQDSGEKYSPAAKG